MDQPYLLRNMKCHFHGTCITTNKVSPVRFSTILLNSEILTQSCTLNLNYINNVGFILQTKMQTQHFAKFAADGANFRLE